MNELYLVRHAAAFEQDPAQWPDDGLRPLSPDGERSFRRAARGLRRLTDPPAIVLSSPFVRAWRTAEILTEEAAWPAPQALDELAQPVDSKAVLDAARGKAPGAPSVALVGHEPYLSELAAMLLGGAAVEMKKGAVARLAMEAGGSAELRWLVPPKILRAVRP